jgi:hypothetical protein
MPSPPCDTPAGAPLTPRAPRIPPPRAAADQTGKEVVDDILQRAAAAGLTTVRTWAHTQASTAPFQLAPGQYSEKGLKALDFVLDSARRAGLQVRGGRRGGWRVAGGARLVSRLCAWPGGRRGAWLWWGLAPARGQACRLAAAVQARE